jgi:hypothetical protein
MSIRPIETHRNGANPLQHPTNSVLKFLVSDGVDERVQTTTGEYGNHCEMIEPTFEVCVDTEIEQKEVDCIPRPAHYETARDGEQSFEYIALGFLIDATRVLIVFSGYSRFE